MRKSERRFNIGPLDPGLCDQGYWDRFQMRVMEGAVPLLARRRTTVSGVMNAWSRLLMPAAAMAAAIAGLIFLQPAAGPGSFIPEITVPTTDGLAMLAVEELAMQPLYTVPDPMPGFLVSEGDFDLRTLLFTLDEF